jgi:hypothetical protein
MTELESALQNMEPARVVQRPAGFVLRTVSWGARSGACRHPSFSRWRTGSQSLASCRLRGRSLTQTVGNSTDCTSKNLDEALHTLNCELARADAKANTVLALTSLGLVFLATRGYGDQPAASWQWAVWVPPA